MTKTFVRATEIDPYGIKELQNAILSITLYFDSFCKEHHIKYFLMGGSALGAMRHKGFIPWDDDLDVFMDYKNYQKLLSVINRIDTKKYHFQKQASYEQPYYFSKLRMNGTTFIDEYVKPDKKIHQGIYIDIMCLYNAPKSKLLKKIQFYEGALLKAKAVQKYGYKTSSIKKKLQLILSNIVVNRLTEKLIYADVCKYSKKNTSEVCHIFGRAKFNNSFYKKAWFKNQRYVNFETVKLPVPNDVEPYLEARFGKDYMKMPSAETKKLYGTHASKWSTTKNYTELMNQ